MSRHLGVVGCLLVSASAAMAVADERPVQGLSRAELVSRYERYANEALAYGGASIGGSVYPARGGPYNLALSHAQATMMELERRDRRDQAVTLEQVRLASERLATLMEHMRRTSEKQAELLDQMRETSNAQVQALNALKAASDAQEGIGWLGLGTAVLALLVAGWVGWSNYQLTQRAGRETQARHVEQSELLGELARSNAESRDLSRSASAEQLSALRDVARAASMNTVPLVQRS